VGGLHIDESVAHWVADAVMSVFFLGVGLEIKHEVTEGDLRERRTAALPVFAAIGGMVVPAALYAVVNVGGPGAHGWGVPMATDIAFALGVLALLERRVPRPLRLFLLSLAVVDDIGAILVIAIFYTDDLRPLWLLGTLGALAVMLVLQRIGVRPLPVYVLLGVVAWWCTYQSGVHATIAAVVIGLLTPHHDAAGRPVLHRVAHAIAPWVNLAVLPLFALVSVGVPLSGAALRDAASSRITLGIVLGLFVGKFVGVVLGVVFARRRDLHALIEGVPIGDFFGAAALSGIGFTVSLFVAELSFRGIAVDDAKIGILVGSLASALLGTALLWPDRDDSARAIPPVRNVPPPRIGATDE
jgi:NhaA family Na+:H+ antiporter